MIARIFILAVIAVSGAMPFGFAQSAPTEKNLKLTHESFVAAIVSGNMTTAEAMIHPRAFGFFRESVRLVELGPNYGASEALPSIVKDLSDFDAVNYNTVYRAMGDTGIVCMTNSFQAKKWSKAKDYYTRSTYVYVIVNGNWKLLSWHTSNTPLK
ncbi:MAG: nuclear transport factor 2 family protein [Acidobacteriota bacterium]